VIHRLPKGRPCGVVLVDAQRGTLASECAHPEEFVTATRLIIVDDHPLFRGALNQALSLTFPAAGIQEASSLDELTRLLAGGEEIDLVLLDLAMPGVMGLSGLLFLRAQHPEVPVIVVSATEDRTTIRRCIEFGAAGFVPKSEPVENIRNAVHEVLAGRVWTPADIDLSIAQPSEHGDLLERISTLTPQHLQIECVGSDDQSSCFADPHQARRG
jgi:DNA-binding NarL/FixJ family response regulator